MVATAPAREGRVSRPGGTVWYQIGGDGTATPLVVVAGRQSAGRRPTGRAAAALWQERARVLKGRLQQLTAGEMPSDIDEWEEEQRH